MTYLLEPPVIVFVLFYHTFNDVALLIDVLSTLRLNTRVTILDDRNLKNMLTFRQKFLRENSDFCHPTWLPQLRDPLHIFIVLP